MQTLVNGTAPYTITTNDPARDLDTWSDSIAALNDALTDAAAARLNLDQLHRTLERIEASIMLGIDGGNAETRKAKLTLALADDHRHAETVTAIDCERALLLDAERRITTGKERCCLARTALALLIDHA